MELHEKLQELRKQKGLTQEELAEILYVSRAAVSKWESGRGYPNIDSLKAISNFFSVTIDDLLSSNELIPVAEETQEQHKKYSHGLIFGLLDISTVMLFFLPFFAEKATNPIQATSLFALSHISLYLKILYLALVIGSVIWGIFMLTLQGSQTPNQYLISLCLNAAGIVLFVLGLHPYAAIFTFVLLSIKAFILLKQP
jgi:transcriptional regulator with XRE-family HTH domain